MARKYFTTVTTVEELIRTLTGPFWTEEATRQAIERYHELAAADNAKKQPSPSRPQAQAAIIELVENRDLGADHPGVMKPNELRINGVPILVPREDFLTIEGANGEDELVAVVRMFARRIVIGEPV